MSTPKPEKVRETEQERAARLEAQTADAAVITGQEFKARSRRSAIVGGAAALAGVLGWRWLGGQREVDNIPALLRAGHRTNESVWRTLHNSDALAPTFPVSASAMPRANGRHGLEPELDPETWSLAVLDADGAELDRLDLEDVRAFEKVEMVTELKCIEGWSQVVHWGGARFSDVAAKYPQAAEAEYVGLATPDGEYAVGMDATSMMHPQTLLCYEMQGGPLVPAHGAPLRLVTPLKYGIKQIKRIGTVQFTDVRPEDYWAERGYDWYSGH